MTCKPKMTKIYVTAPFDDSGVKEMMVLGDPTAPALPVPEGWRPIADAPRDGTWLIALSNDRTHAYRISWGVNQSGEECWCSSTKHYYGDGLFGLFRIQGDLPPRMATSPSPAPVSEK